MVTPKISWKSEFPNFWPSFLSFPPSNPDTQNIVRAPWLVVNSTWLARTAGGLGIKLKKIFRFFRVKSDRPCLARSTRIWGQNKHDEFGRWLRRKTETMFLNLSRYLALFPIIVLAWALEPPKSVKLARTIETDVRRQQCTDGRRQCVSGRR